MFLLYSLCFTAGFCLALPYFVAKGIFQKKYFSNFGQRLGLLPFRRAETGGSTWLHAVSVGEVLAVVPLARALKQRWPERLLYVSTTTHTGQQLAKERLSQLATVFYFPFDWRFSVRHALDSVRPDLVVIAETEIWPNFLRECSERSIPVLLVNGRISDRSVRRYGMARRFVRKTLELFSSLLMQTQLDLERILSLGAPGKRSEVCGNLKFDLCTPKGIAEKVEQYRSLFSLQEGTFLVAAGSTMKDEEELVLAAFSKLKRTCPQAVLLLAPRHPERFKEVEQLLSAAGWRFVKRSALDARSPSTGAEVILLDSIGELATLYALSDVVFVGGSLVPRGGHNILEPALFGKPVLFGPHMQNFRETAGSFLQQRAAFQVGSPEELGERFIELARDETLRTATGARGHELLKAHQGATQRIVNRIGQVLQSTP